MRCPKCTSIEDKVIDSRIARDGNTIRRRRECLECGHRFTTNEALVRDRMVVIKRDGRQEPFLRDKLIGAVRAACHKRPVDGEQIYMLVEDVIAAAPLFARAGLMEGLKRLAAFPESTVLVTNLRAAYCPPRGRWTSRREREYDDTLSLLQQLAATPSPERTTRRSSLRTSPRHPPVNST